MTIQTSYFTDNEAANQFALAVEQYCAFIENCAHLVPYQFVTQTLDHLANLLKAGLNLPDWGDTDVSEEEEGEEITSIEIAIEQIWAIQATAREKLGKHDFYYFVFDPLEEEPPSVVGSAVGHDLESIYADLKRPLLALQKPQTYSVSNILFEWKHGYYAHWGRHLAGAQWALQNMLIAYIVRKE